MEQFTAERRDETASQMGAASHGFSGDLDHELGGVIDGRDVAARVPPRAAGPRNRSTDGRSCREVAARRATPASRHGARHADAERSAGVDLRSSRNRGRRPEPALVLPPDHEAFVDWFVSYWRRRGAYLFAERAPDENAA